MPAIQPSLQIAQWKGIKRPVVFAERPPRDLCIMGGGAAAYILFRRYGIAQGMF